MKLFVHKTCGPVTRELRQSVERHIGAALAKMQDRISRVDVFIRDENGPRGGVDLVARVVVQLTRHGSICVQDQHYNLRSVLARIGQRTQRAVGRSLERRRAEPIRQHQRLAKNELGERRSAAALQELATMAS